MFRWFVVTVVILMIGTACTGFSVDTVRTSKGAQSPLVIVSL
jgi:hypothetical protein